MGTPVRNNFLSGRQKKMSKGLVDHTKKWVELWLAAVSLCRAPIGWLSPLSCLFTSPSCWGTHFLYLSNPPSGNLRPIIPCISTSLAQFLPPLLLLTAACLCSHILSLFTLVTTDCNYCGPAFNRFEEMDKYCKFASTFLNYKQNDVDK